MAQRHTTRATDAHDTGESRGTDTGSATFKAIRLSGSRADSGPSNPFEGMFVPYRWRSKEREHVVLPVVPAGQ